MKKIVFFIFLIVASLVIRCGAQGCATCGGFAAGGAQGQDVGPNFSVSLGATQYGQSAGTLTFDSSQPDPSLFTPMSLQFNAPTRGDVQTMITNMVTTILTTNIETDAVLVTNVMELVTPFAGENNGVYTLFSGIYGGAITSDAIGNLYIADYFDNVVRKIAARTGLVTRVAGNGTSGYSGDGGAATSAHLSFPSGVVVDGSGNLYIADLGNNVVRKVTASTGIITTVAGNGSPGYTGDGGAATTAQLNGPISLTLDGSANLYIADSVNDRVRKVTAGTGIITTVAGNGSWGSAGDGGPATSANLNVLDDYLYGMSVDSSGNLFIADTGNNVIRKVAVGTGIITTVAGNGTGGYFGDGGAATSANLSHPCAVTADSSGNLFIADFDNNVIRKVTVGTGIITTVAGNGSPGSSGDGGMATNATIANPVSVTMDNAGNLFIADNGNHGIRRVTATGVIMTVAFNGTGGYSGDGGAGTSAQLNGPFGVTGSSSGTMYIADTDNNVIRKMAASGIISTVAGNGNAGYSGNGGSATSASLSSPNEVAVDASGNLFIADSGNNVIRKVVISTGIITTVAGTGSAGYSGNGGAATSAMLNIPSGVTLDSSGNLYIADTLNNVIRKVTTGGIISTVAGNGSSGYSGDGGTATSAKLNNPSKVTVDSSGILYIADTGNNVIRKLSTGGIISTVAGNGILGCSGDGGAATNAELNKPLGVLVDGTGDLYIADTGNNVVREVFPTGIITTTIGNIGAYSQPTTIPTLNSPSDVALDSSGNLYVADTANNVIAKVSGQSVTNISFNEVTSTNVTTTFVTNAVIRQVVSPQILADVPVPPTSNGYVINFYYPANIVGTNSDGTCQISGTPFVTWLITNSNPMATFQLQISEFGVNPAYGLIKQKTYNYSNTTGGWSVQSLGGIVENMVTTNLNSSTYQVIDSLQNASGPVVQQVVNTYQTLNWSTCTNVALVTNSIGTGSSAEVTTCSYWDPATFGAKGLNLLKTVVHSDGSWEYYSVYDSLGRATTVYSSFQDAAVNDTSNGRESDYTYNPTNAGVSSTGDNGTLNIYTPRLVVGKVQGHEVSRQYNVFPSAGTNYQVQCLVAGAVWNASGNLITTNLYFTNGPNQFYLQSSLNPDGTLSTFNYLTNGTYQTNITITGQPDSTHSYVVDGISNVVVLNISGYNVMASDYDVLSGLKLKQDIYGNFDSYGRPQQVTHLDGTTEYTYYACCGVDNTVNRDGLTTAYLYDTDKRAIGYEQIYSSGTNNAITYENTLDAANRTVQTYRVGSDGSTIMAKQLVYDTAGELIFMTNALNGGASYTRAHDPTTAAWIRTLTNPDGGIVASYYYADGSLKKAVGSGAHGHGYGYGYATDVNGNTCTYSTSTNLDNNGNLTAEWTKTFTDMAGRTTEILYADGHYSQSFYNGRGELAKQIDPDGVVTLYQCNAKGEQAYSAIDLNRNGAIDFSGSDRIQQTTNDVITDHSTVVRRTQNYVWLDGSSTGTLVSSTETSASGLDTWQAQYRDTSTTVATHSQTVPGVSRTVTTTAPDGSYIVSAYSYGRLISTARYDSTSVQIGGTIYGYDAQGRQNTMTDARNGTTTLGFNNADLMTTNTTPNPGGGSPEVTVTAYNNMLQATSVLQPDGTTVSSVYLLTGELALQSGSRIYPASYNFDYSGRQKTMTNWSGFGTLAGARVTTWNYDPYRGFLTNKTYDGGAAGPSYTYTGAGRLASRIWARGITTGYGYNNGGSLTNVVYSDGATPGVTNSYDRLGRLSSVVCNGMTDTLTYNLANELLGEAFSGGILNGLSVTNTYDPYLRRTNLASLNGSATVAKAIYGYDNASRLSTVSDGTDTAAYSYLANSPLVSQIVFKQSGTTRMTTSKAYDYLNRLTQMSSTPAASGALPVNFNYNYNAANQRTHNTLADGSYWVYGYDALGQVTNACKYFPDGTPVAGQQFDYTFDTIGNRTQTLAGGDATGQNLRMNNYYANNLNQVTNRDVAPYADVMGASILTNTVTVNGQTAYRKEEYFRQQLGVNNTNSALWTNIIVSGGQNVTGNVYVARSPEVFKYDGDGNLTNDGRWAYVWDGENRLKSMTVNTNIGPQYLLTFAYDYQGRRIQKIVSTNSTGIYTNKFLYDGWNLIAEVNPTNAAIRSYMWGSDLSGSQQGAGGVGGLLEVSYYGTSTTNCFPAFDGNGNVAALVNAADGTTLANYEYGPFGEPIRITGAMANNSPFLFSTKYYDTESGLYYYGYRFYNPSTGTWPSRDPIEERGGENLYNFIHNDSIDNQDVLGQMQYNDLIRILIALNKSVEKEHCCCDKKTYVQISINGTPSGQKVTESISILGEHPCGLERLHFYWWDCFTAAREYEQDNSPNKPTNLGAFKLYGWVGGSISHTRSERGMPWMLGIIDYGDAYHWNWQAAMMYVYCGIDGRKHAGMALSNAQEWTWNGIFIGNGWGNPHDGTGNVPN